MVVENAFHILVSRFRVLLGTMKQRPKVVRDIVLTYVLFHNMLRTHQVGVARAPNTQNEISAIVNEPVANGADDNCRYPMRKTKQQRDLLKDYLNHIDALALQEKRISNCEKDLLLGQKKLVSISPFQDYSIIPKTFTFKLVLHEYPTNFETNDKSQSNDYQL